MEDPKGDAGEYTQYIMGIWKPHLEDLRKAAKLSKGKLRHVKLI